MILKDKSNFSKWQFYMEDPDGKELCLPSEDSFAPSFDALVKLVKDQISNFPASYLQAVSFNASKLGMEYNAYLRLSIEHQICKRQEDPYRVCWDGGLGDHIHTLAGKIDQTIDKMPEILKGVGQAVVKAATLMATGKPQKRLGSCSTCGGTRTFVPAVNNLGRAGALNVVVPLKK